MWDTDNVFLNGPFTPWREEGEAFDLEIEGEIPAGLDGALYRVAQNQHFRPANPDRYHQFDGDGMVHAVFLRDGRATYRNKYVQTAGLKMEMQEGRALFSSVINGGGEPLKLEEGRPPFKNAGNTHVTLFNDRLLVFAEVDVPHELRPDTLETVGTYDFHGKVSGPVTAHWKIDPENGDMLFYGSMNGEITWYRADKHGNLLDTFKFNLGAPSFVHDFAVTKNYAIFCLSPQLFDPMSLFQGNPSVIWDTEAVPVSKFAVMHRATGKVTWFEADEPFQTTHYYNAYEEGQTVVVDAHRTVTRLGHLRSELTDPAVGRDFNEWFTKSRTVPTRWRLDLATGRLAENAHSDITGDFPRVNDDRTGLEHRFHYMVTMLDKGDWLFDGLAKHDIARDHTDIKVFDGLEAPSEAVFVPREGATSEDDGWLLSMWWDPAEDRTEVIIQDAQDFTGAPVARIKLNHRVPLGFHGSWIPSSEIEAALRSGE